MSEASVQFLGGAHIIFELVLSREDPDMPHLEDVDGMKHLEDDGGMKHLEDVGGVKLDASDFVDIVSHEVRIVKLFIPVDSAVSKKLVVIIVFIIKSLNQD